MKALTSQETISWCRANDVALSDFDLPDQTGADLKFDIPVDAQKRVALVRRAMKAFAGEPAFLVWFHDWSVWPSGQRMHVFERFRMSYGETRHLIDSPGHLFDKTEIEDAISFVTIAALFLWDCYVVTPGRTKLLHLSHDEWGMTKGIDLREQSEKAGIGAREFKIKRLL